MHVSTFFAVAVVLGYHVASACPPQRELENKVQRCLTEMMKFVQADESDRRSKCPNLKEGVDCVDSILESCKDNAALQGQYSMLKERLAQSRQDFDGFCNEGSCPPPNQLVDKIQSCLGKMMSFIEADANDRRSQCPNLKEGVDCIDDLLESCKDNPGLRSQYDMLKQRLVESRKDFQGFCGNAAGVSSSLLLLFAACALSLWFKN